MSTGNNMAGEFSNLGIPETVLIHWVIKGGIFFRNYSYLQVKNTLGGESYVEILKIRFFRRLCGYRCLGHHFMVPLLCKEGVKGRII
jgi:hypothetical protein